MYVCTCLLCSHVCFAVCVCLWTLVHTFYIHTLLVVYFAEDDDASSQLTVTKSVCHVSTGVCVQMYTSHPAHTGLTGLVMVFILVFSIT